MMFELIYLDAVNEAIRTIMFNSDIDKLEGRNWKVYRVGITIRIDLK